MQLEKFSIRKRSQSFGYAFAGVIRFFRSEHNAWLHLAATAGVVVLAIVLPVSGLETALLVFAVGFVWVAELFNTCIEKIMDFISTERHPKIQIIKDMSAGAVLLAAITALVTGMAIFVPKIV
ncbi:MAG TPA: diacylglycerol kinase family protein [Chitinophagaceae bacterium]|nr:diacylglycerol kinase family protein [Chitinophagaceae bacterium]